MSDKIIAMIDGSAFSTSVLDLSAWVALRNRVPVHLLHVLPPKEAPQADLSGALRLGARTALLGELAALDEQRARVAMAQGRALLDDATARLHQAGVEQVTAQLRQGDVLDSVATLEGDSDLIVIGKRGVSAQQAQGHLGSHFERIVRASRLPVLMAPREWRNIARVAIACDGSASSRRAVARAAALPAYRGLSVDLVGVGGDAVAEALEQARALLSGVGIAADTVLIDAASARAHPDRAILRHLDDSGADFLVMGAYGHSRIRNLMVGSTTTAILREARIPVLLVR
ncbi:universal stress protein [Paracoccus jiaweipingae]|uniref:universal stress protein n=1 Tax=unclassified Paracoccus (in: a-proteobacteria) TaxID=2688777 RepID=UPI00379E696F